MFRLCPRGAGAIVGVVCATLLGGCATMPREAGARAEFKAQNDPLEPLNRKMFALNEFVDRAALKPLAKGYVKVVPRPARDALRNLLDNLNEPLVLLNNLLQAEFKRSGIAAARFLMNTIAGPVGLRDVASRAGLAKQTGDFGQTLYSWGIHDGPYLVIPILGPSNPRDAVGLGGDVYLDPFRYVARRQNLPTIETTGRMVAFGIDERSRNIDSLDAMQRESIDYYAAMRSFFRQHRAAEVRHGMAAPVPADFYQDPGTTPLPDGANDKAGVSR